MAMGLSKDEARESLRFSWGRDTTEADIDTVSGLVVDHVNRIRSRTASRSNECAKSI